MRAIRMAAMPSLAAAVLLFVFVVSAAAAGVKPGSVAGASGKLVPDLQRLASPALRTASAGARARALSLPAEGPGSMLRLGNKVVATARVSSTAAPAVQALAGAGAQVLAVSGRYGTITFAATPADLESVAALPAVRSVQPELTPITSGQGAAGLGSTPAQVASTNAVTCPWGSARSEGDTQLHAADARAAFGIDGSGVEVGIVSDSFGTNTSAATNASDDVASGDLPGAGNPCGLATPVQNLSNPDYPDGADEGRALAQTVHDLAPRAPLAFASGLSATSFPDAVKALQTAGARVIVDDLTYFNEPFFQDGPDAVAVDQAAAAGVPYFSSAVNSNVIVGGDNVGSWEAPSFRAATTGCPSGMPSGYAACMNFDPNGGTSNSEAITLGPGGGFKLDLQWNEPWGGVTTDLDVFVMSAAGAVLAKSTNDNASPVGIHQPFEFLAYTNTTGANQTVYLAIGKWAGADNPRVKYVLLGASNILGVQFPTSSGGDVVGPTIFGHNGAPGAMTMGAVPFNDSSSIESYSARGPVTHYYGPDTGIIPAAPLSRPAVLAKPDAAATDGAATTFYGQLTSGVWRFYGTSDSAAHAAAIAALQLQADPTATVSQVYGAERSTAAAVGSYSADAAGSGLLDALGAVKALLPPPTASTGVASAVGLSSATVAGIVNPEGYDTGYWFEYGTSTAYGSSTPLGDAGAGTTDVPVSAQLSSLSPSTTYHYRVVAVRDGTVAATGDDQTFTTSAPAPPPPIVTTGGASGVGASSATVAGTVNPEGHDTGYWFEYGTSTAYGSSTPAGDAGAGTTDVPVSARLSGLARSTTYHYRLVAVRDGTVAATGDDQAFTTRPPAHRPPVNGSLPTITGVPTSGSMLLCSPGTWSGASSLTYQWLRDGAPLPDDLESTLILTGSDIDHEIACLVTATNCAGAAYAVSPAVEVQRASLATPLVRLIGSTVWARPFVGVTSGPSVVPSIHSGRVVVDLADEFDRMKFSVERLQSRGCVTARCRHPESTKGGNGCRVGSQRQLHVRPGNEHSAGERPPGTAPNSLRAIDWAIRRLRISGLTR